MAPGGHKSSKIEEKFQKYDATTNKNSFCGNKLIYHAQMEELSRQLSVDAMLSDVDDDYDDYDDYDDGQPDEYTEWQDVYGGDDWDHGQYDEVF